VQTAKKRSYFVIMIIASITFAAAVAASIVLQFAKSENLSVIYYGHHLDDNSEITKQKSLTLAATPVCSCTIFVP